MKKITLLITSFCMYAAFSQTSPKFDVIKLKNEGDYKAADSFALEAANILLSTKIEKGITNRNEASVFLIKWMAGTPDYSFSPDAELVRGDENLVEIYMACLTKYCLENKSLAKNKKIVRLNSTRLFLNYCSNPNNNVSMNDHLKQLAEANKKGELEKIL